MTTASDQVLDIVADKLDPATVAIIRAALDDAHRLTVIRDAFLEGRDILAVQMIRDLDPIGIRRILGISGDALIPVGQGAQFAVRPQIPFTADHFAVSPSLAACFVIEDITCCNRSQFPQAGSVPGDLFATDVDEILRGTVDDEGFYNIKIGKAAEARWGLPISVPCTEPGSDIIVTVRCIDTNRLVGDFGMPFRAAFLGTCKRY